MVYKNYPSAVLCNWNFLKVSVSAVSVSNQGFQKVNFQFFLDFFGQHDWYVSAVDLKWIDLVLVFQIVLDPNVSREKYGIIGLLKDHKGPSHEIQSGWRCYFRKGPRKFSCRIDSLYFQRSFILYYNNFPHCVCKELHCYGRHCIQILHATGSHPAPAQYFYAVNHQFHLKS